MNRFPFALGEIYHVYNRGVDKRITFETLYDYERFKVLLHLANSTEKITLHNDSRDMSDLTDYWDSRTGTPLVAIGAWVLMPNHFHLILKEITEDGISLFMQKLSTAYTMYFNKSRDRTGALFQGRFKARRVVEDAYMRHLYAYIHMNPMKLKDAAWQSKSHSSAFVRKHLDYITQFPHSSGYEFTADAKKRPRKEASLITPREFPSYGAFMDHVTELQTWFKTESDK